MSTIMTLSISVSPWCMYIAELTMLVLCSNLSIAYFYISFRFVNIFMLFFSIVEYSYLIDRSGSSTIKMCYYFMFIVILFICGIYGSSTIFMIILVLYCNPYCILVHGTFHIIICSY